MSFQLATRWPPLLEDGDDTREGSAMERQGDEIHISTGEASGGSTPHIVRYVLAISLVLAIAALSAIWMIGAATQ